MLDLFFRKSTIVVSTLTLLLPDLAAIERARHALRCPTTDLFISRCATSLMPDTTTVAWACARNGITRQRDWPAAAILARAMSAAPPHPFWLCAQPAHLAVDRDRLLLLPRRQLPLSDRESHALLSTLREVFVREGLALAQVDAGTWLIGCPHVQRLQTFAPELVEGRDIDAYQPRGEDAPRWQRLLTEIQMLLHEHPVNVERDQRGDTAVNSLWLWGGGGMPNVTARFDRMIVRSPFLLALAAATATPVAAQQSDGAHAFGAGHLLVEVEHEAGKDVEALLHTVEAAWLEPAWQALAEGKLDEVTLAFPVGSAMAEAHCNRRARSRLFALRFGKRLRSLHEFLERWQEHT